MSVALATDIDTRVVEAKASSDAIGKLIIEFEPFMQGVTSKYCQQFSFGLRDELYSVVLVAFYEAIQKFEAQKGHFLPFSKQVIHARVIDYMRPIMRNMGRTIAVDYQSTEKQSTDTALYEVSTSKYIDEQVSINVQDEIEQFAFELSSWGISITELSKNTPKHKKLVKSYRDVIKLIYEDKNIVDTIRYKHYYPRKEIQRLTGLSLKKIEHSRTYVLASFIILMGDYEYLSEYVPV